MRRESINCILKVKNTTLTCYCFVNEHKVMDIPEYKCEIVHAGCLLAKKKKKLC